MSSHSKRTYALDTSLLSEVKNKIEKYAQQCGHFETFIPIGAGWFFENFLSKEAAPVFGGFPHFSNAEGIRTFRVPYWGGEERVPFLSISDDFGDIVQGIFLEPTRWNGHFVHGISAIRSFSQLVEQFEQGFSLSIFLYKWNLTLYG